MSVGHRDHGVVIMRLILLASLLAGCSALPMDGTVLDAISEDPELEPVSCQCNVYCGA